MKTKDKWYNDLQLIGTLLFFWPPVGIYGLYKSEAIEPKWKKVTYSALVIVFILWVTVLLI